MVAKLRIQFGAGDLVDQIDRLMVSELGEGVESRGQGT